MKRLLAAAWLGKNGQVVHLHDVNFGTGTVCGRQGQLTRTYFERDDLCQKCLGRLKADGWSITRLGEFDVDAENNAARDKIKMSWEEKS